MVLEFDFDKWARTLYFQEVHVDKNALQYIYTMQWLSCTVTSCNMTHGTLYMEVIWNDRSVS